MSAETDVTRGEPKVVMARMGRLTDEDRAFDIAFWQAQASRERLNAAWQMVVDYHVLHGGTPDGLRLQRSVARLKRRRS